MGVTHVMSDDEVITHHVRSGEGLMGSQVPTSCVCNFFIVVHQHVLITHSQYSLKELVHR